jgi:geranylgeranyl reductase family protein
VDYDVIIAGAGPGGISAAMRLCTHAPALAPRILVLDKATFPRAKPCGGGLTGHCAEAMAALGLELDVPCIASATARVRFGEHARQVALPRPVKVVRREDFDASLVRQARARGVVVREGEGLEAFDVHDGGVTVKTSSGRLRARVLIGADGAGSLVRKRLRPRDPVPIRLFRAEIPAPRDYAGGDEMVYDFSLMRHGLRGYLWIFPVPEGRLNVGLMHYPSQPLSGAELIELLRKGLCDLGLAEVADQAVRAARGWPAWGYRPSAPVAAPHVLTLGDAAGIDALTGEGIAVAMEHALVAGDAVLSALDRGDFSFATYRQALRKSTVGRELNLDRWLARLLYGRQRWQGWLSLVLFDPDVLELYAARVAGGLVLADQKRRMWSALFRHVLQWPQRKRQLQLALTSSAASDRSRLCGEVASP